MKKFIFILIVSLYFTTQAQQHDYDAYYVIVAWENSPTFKNHVNQPIVSNVASNGCKPYLKTSATTQFREYWKAYYQNYRGDVDIHSITEHNFETADEAEAFRRNIISKHNSETIGGGALEKRNTIIIKNFKLFCN